MKRHTAPVQFGDRDLRVIGALDAGQYSTVRNTIRCLEEGAHSTIRSMLSSVVSMEVSMFVNR